MSLVTPDRIMCFECVEIVDPVVFNGVEHLQCCACGQAAPVEKAMDDCFLFIVYSAVTESLKKDYARTYKFMPAQDERAKVLAMRTFMLRSGRALMAA